MDNIKNTSSTKLASKIRSSLVIKLNIQMIGRIFSGFLAINILLFLMGLFVLLYQGEKGAQNIIETIEFDINSLESIYYGNYEILRVEKPSSGIVLPSSIQKSLPFKKTYAKRNILIPKIDKDKGLLKRIGLIKYIIAFSQNDVYYEIIYDLDPDLRLFLFLFLIILMFQLLIIIKNISKGSRMIRKTLKPLSDLAETTKNLNIEVSSINSRADGTHIKDLAGVISSIDANRLDRRISVDSFQDELKDLTFAINDMLNRISDSYESQVRFVSDASHELRTPISVIQGYVNLLDRWGKEDEKTMQESIDAIKSETENMKELVEQLLFLARGDNETIQLHKEDFDACEVLEEVTIETQMIDSNHNFQIDFRGPAYINADRQLFKQAIRILVDNSIKFTPGGEKIILNINNEKGYVYITVQDSGIGIDPEDLPYIFDRFYRSDESRARNTGGTGLGLSIAKWIIENHQAKFEVLSRVDIGTRITIIFPATEMSVSEYVDDR